MSDNRNIISSENWVELYATLSNYILEYSSLDPIWIVSEDGTEVRTEEKQDEFIDIVDQVEAIMETVLIKESSNKIDQGDVADIEYIQTETGMVPKDLTDTINIRDDIHHQIDVITDSDWFDELVEEKVREALAKRREASDDNARTN